MLPWPIHNDAPRWHQICQYPYTCCPHASSVCVHLSSFPCLHTHEFSMSCVRGVGVQTNVGTCVPLLCDILRTLGADMFQWCLCTCLKFCCWLCSHHSPLHILKPPPQHPPCYLSQTTTIGGGLPPSIMGSWRLHCCAEWRTRVDYVFTTTLSMPRRDLTPILPTTHHPCMQPFSAPHSYPPHGMSANLIKLFSKYSFQSFADTRQGVWISSVNSQPWRFTVTFGELYRCELGVFRC